MDADIEAMRLDFLRAVLKMERIAQDEAMPTAEKIELLRSFWDEFRWAPRQIESRHDVGEGPAVCCP